MTDDEELIRLLLSSGMFFAVIFLFVLLVYFSVVT